jgi:hypothetical protein
MHTPVLNRGVEETESHKVVTEKVTITKTAKEFPKFLGNPGYMIVFKTIRHWTQICVRWIKSKYLHNVKTHCKTILPHITIRFPSCFTFRRTIPF